MRENRTSGSMRGYRKRTTAQRACALLYRSPWLVGIASLDGALFLLEQLHVPSSITGWAAQIPLWGMIYLLHRYYNVWYERVVSNFMIGRLEQWASRAQQWRLARLSLPIELKPAIMCVRAAGDEAKRYLDAVRGAGNMPYGVWNGRVYLALAGVLSVLAFFWPVLVPEWLRGNSNGLLQLILPSLAAGTAAAILLSLGHFAVLAMFPRFVRGHSGGFGQESFLDNMLLHISARATLESVGSIDREYHLDGTGLRHSGLYESENVINDIVDWIRASAPGARRPQLH